MLTSLQSVLANQYGAALTMLQACIESAGPAEWEQPVGRFPFWHVAYHVLFYTDFYLSPAEAAFERRPFHREDHNFFGHQPWPPHKPVAADVPYDRDTLLEYVGWCRRKVAGQVERETDSTLNGPSGFEWLPFTRLELHLYNIRHLQHHMGQLGALLARVQGQSVPWVGTKRP